MRRATISLLAAGLAALACVAVWPAFQDPVTWTPDALYYEARVLELRGANHDEAIDRTFEGPLSAELRARDPEHTGDPTWVAYNEPFYERRVAVPLAAAAVYPLAGDRSLLYLSLAGYIVAIVSLFLLLLKRFRVAIAAGVAAATVFLPPLTNHVQYPLTDSWGLALEIGALGAALLTLDRGLRWLPLWVGTIALLAFTRDSTWIPILAVGWVAFRYRSRAAVVLSLTGLAAALPALLLFKAPVRDLLALLVNDSDVSGDTSWGFILSHYPQAVLELVRANLGFLRRGEWYAALYFVGGVLSLFTFAWRQRPTRSVSTSFLTAATVVAILYVLAAPVFSAFRLELSLVPMAAWGLALLAELGLARVGARQEGAYRHLALRARRS